MKNTYIALPTTVEAFRYLRGITSKTEMLEFCPIANIGTLNGADSTEFAWLTIAGEDVRPGDYVVKNGRGEFSVWRAKTFREAFAEQSSFGCFHVWVEQPDHTGFECSSCGMWGMWQT